MRCVTDSSLDKQPCVPDAGERIIAGEGDRCFHVEARVQQNFVQPAHRGRLDIVFLFGRLLLRVMMQLSVRASIAQQREQRRHDHQRNQQQPERESAIEERPLGREER